MPFKNTFSPKAMVFFKLTESKRITESSDIDKGIISKFDRDGNGDADATALRGVKSLRKGLYELSDVYAAKERIYIAVVREIWELTLATQQFLRERRQGQTKFPCA